MRNNLYNNTRGMFMWKTPEEIVNTIYHNYDGCLLCRIARSIVRLEIKRSLTELKEGRT